jgi:hypothetical protein
MITQIYYNHFYYINNTLYILSWHLWSMINVLHNIQLSNQQKFPYNTTFHCTCINFLIYKFVLFIFSGNNSMENFDNQRKSAETFHQKISRSCHARCAKCIWKSQSTYPTPSNFLSELSFQNVLPYIYSTVTHSTSLCRFTHNYPF